MKLVKKCVKEFGNTLRYVLRHKPLIILLAAAAVAQLSTIVFSGTYLCINNRCGDYFWGVHEHDGIWHLAVAAVSFKSWPFVHPVYSGMPLSGYNLLLDLVIFLASKIGLPFAVSYFKVLPVVWFVLFSWLSLKYARAQNNSRSFVWLLLFLFFFGTSFSFFINLYHGDLSIANTSGMLTMQALSSLTNLQVAFSYIIFVAVIYLLMTRRLSLTLAVAVSFFVFLDIGLKFYAGIVIGVLVGVFFVCQLFRRDMKALLYLLILGLFSVLSIIFFYNPFQAAKGGMNIFAFNPFATVHPIIEDPSLIYLKDLVNARYFLQQSGKFSPRLVAIELLTLLLFMIFNLGVRVTGLLFLVIQGLRKRLSQLDFSTFIALLFALLFPVFFTQKGEWWNSIQFFYFGTFLLNIYTAKAFSRIKNRAVLSVLIAVIVVVSVPSNLDMFISYLPTNGAVYVSKGELEALRYLKSKKDGTVAVPLYNQSRKGTYGKYSPLYSHIDSAYVAAYSGKQVYLANVGQVRLTNIDFSARYNSLKTGDCSVLQDIEYVYYPKDQYDVFLRKCVEKNPLFRMEYSNSSAVVYVKK